ncbi:hypothetical protein, partial [Escherichia coli]|uniref:hypothetical protein n=1 Tax=Escherichia coli TaxID=562 RepID=UPI001A93D396
MGSCAAPSAKGDDKFITTDYLQQCPPDDAADAWSNIVDDARSNQAVPALSLYSGNHWSTAKEILNSTRNLELWIISAGMGFLNSRDRVPSYEATFHQVPFRHDLWWKAITKSLGKHNRCATISQLMQSSPNDEYLIAASPVYIAAVQNDILKGIESLTHPLTQLTIVTSGAYAGPLEEYLIKEGANKQVISSQADSLIKISRIWADFFPANTSN